ECAERRWRYMDSHLDQPGLFLVLGNPAGFFSRQLRRPWAAWGFLGRHRRVLDSGSCQRVGIYARQMERNGGLNAMSSLLLAAILLAPQEDLKQLQAVFDTT